MKRLASALLVLWLLSSALYGGSQPSIGSDLWWTLAAGRHISQSSQVPDTDVFTHTASGLTWHNQEWLAQVFYWQVFDTLGPDGLVYVKLLLSVVFTFLLAWLAARRSGSPFVGLSAAAVILLAFGHYIDLRAQFFTFLGTVTLLLFLDAFRKGSREAAFGPPLVLLLWVNLHYGFIFGLGVIFATWVGETVKSIGQLPADPLPRKRCRTLGWLFLASLAACAFNPQGIDALLFPFEILDSSTPWSRIIEWRPPRLFREGAPSPFVVLLALQIATVAVTLLFARRRLDLTEAGIVLVTALMAARSRRFVPLFGVVGAPFLARNIVLIARASATQFPRLHRFQSRYGPTAAALIGLTGSIWVGANLWTHGSNLIQDGLFARMTYADRFPAGAARFVSKNAISGNLYNFYAWGGYLAFHTQQPTYIDGRAHAVFPPELYYERRRIETLRPGWEKTLTGRNIDVVVHRSIEALPLKLRRRANWVRVYDDGSATVFVRRTAKTAEVLEKFARGELWYPPSAGAQLFAAELINRAGRRREAVDSMVAVLETQPEAGEAAALEKILVETTAARFVPDARAAGSAEALALALERHQGAFSPAEKP